MLPKKDRNCSACIWALKSYVNPFRAVALGDESYKNLYARHCLCPMFTRKHRLRKDKRIVCENLAPRCSGYEEVEDLKFAWGFKKEDANSSKATS